MQAIAVVVILAALAYILYLWSKRGEMIECPNCGTSIDVYADACPNCGHAKGEPAESPDQDIADLVEEDTTHSDEEVAAAASTDYDVVVAGTVAEVKERVKSEDLDPAKVLAAEQEHRDRVTLTDWLERRAED